MARDASYEPGVYRSQGGNVLTVSTTDGRLNVESGGQIVVKSGGYITLQAGAILNSSGSLSGDSVTVTSTGTLTNNGTVENKGTLNSTGTVNLKAGGTTNFKGTAASTGTWNFTAGTVNYKGATVNSSGTLNLNAGGTVNNKGTLTSTGTVNLNAGTVTNKVTIQCSSDGVWADSITNSKAAAATINGYGISLIGSSTAGARAYKLNRPLAKGCRKTLYVGGSTGGLTVISATAAGQTCRFNGTKVTITFGANADGMALDLIGASSTNWAIVGYSTGAVTTYKAT